MTGAGYIEACHPTGARRSGSAASRSPRVTSSARAGAIVERNYRVREGEIDLIARRGDVLAFCEVKTLVSRANRTSGPANPVESVGYRKQARVRRMARTWLASHAGTGAADLRLDVIGVVLSPAGELLRLEHLEGAF